MKKNYLLIILACFFLQGYTFPEEKISSYECNEACLALSHDPVQAQWLIEDQKLFHAPLKAQKSFGYKKKITFAQLQKGISIPTLGPGAIIRISPLNLTKIPSLQITTPKDQKLSLQDASSLYDRDASFADNSFKENQSLIQLKPELGFGSFQLRTDEKNFKQEDSFIISVYDKYSNLYITVETNKQEYQENDELVATITLKDTIDYPLEEISAAIVIPQGETLPLKLSKISTNQFQGKTSLRSKNNSFGANWYVEAEVTMLINDQLITRQGHTAFSYVIPSAKLTQLQKTNDDPLTFKAEIDVAVASRYALQSVLFYKDSEGTMHPFSTNQSANWLEPGQHTMEFVLEKNDKTLYEESALYLGYFHIIDYGQLKTVYHFDQPISLLELG